MNLGGAGGDDATSASPGLAANEPDPERERDAVDRAERNPARRSSRPSTTTSPGMIKIIAKQTFVSSSRGRSAPGSADFRGVGTLRRRPLKINSKTRTKRPPQVDELRAAFNVFDREGKGFVEIKEMKSLCYALGIKMTKRRVRGRAGDCERFEARSE